MHSITVECCLCWAGCAPEYIALRLCGRSGSSWFLSSVIRKGLSDEVKLRPMLGLAWWGWGGELGGGKSLLQNHMCVREYGLLRTDQGLGMTGIEGSVTSVEGTH